MTHRVVTWVDGDRLRIGIAPASELLALALPVADRPAEVAILTRVAGLALVELSERGIAR